MPSECDQFILSWRETLLWSGGAAVLFFLWNLFRSDYGVVVSLVGSVGMFVVCVPLFRFDVKARMDYQAAKGAEARRARKRNR